jgi:hypothetical protein
MEYASELMPTQPNPPPKKAGRPQENYYPFLRKLYHDVDEKRISSLAVYRCEWKKKTISEIIEERMRHERCIKHIDYIIYEKKIEELKSLKPPTL